MTPSEFSQWMKNQERQVANAGYPIKIRTKKQDNIRTIFAVIGVTLITVSILSAFAFKVLASDENSNETKLITIHHIHTVELSEDTKLWIENKSTEAGDWIREELE